MNAWQVILGSGAVAAVITWLLNLLRDRRAADEARREKHRDRIQAAVGDFLVVEHARYRVDVELTKAHDVVVRMADQRMASASARSASDQAKNEMIALRPNLAARTLEAEQAASRIELLDVHLGTLARAVANTHADPNYAPRTEGVPDSHTDALQALLDAARKVLDVPEA